MEKPLLPPKSDSDARAKLSTWGSAGPAGPAVIRLKYLEIFGDFRKYFFDEILFPGAWRCSFSVSLVEVDDIIKAVDI